MAVQIKYSFFSLLKLSVELRILSRNYMDKHSFKMSKKLSNI